MKSYLHIFLVHVRYLFFMDVQILRQLITIHQLQMMMGVALFQPLVDVLIVQLVIITHLLILMMVRVIILTQAVVQLQHVMNIIGMVLLILLQVYTHRYSLMQVDVIVSIHQILRQKVQDVRILLQIIMMQMRAQMMVVVHIQFQLNLMQI